MGTTSATPTIEAIASKSDADFEKIKYRIHESAKKIIASFPEKMVYLSRISQGPPPLVRIATSPAGKNKEQSSDTSDLKALVQDRPNGTIESPVRSITSTASDSTLTSASPLKRKRRDSDQNDISLPKMKKLLAIERGSFIANMDSLLLSLNLHQLTTCDTCRADTNKARNELMCVLANRRSEMLKDLENPQTYQLSRSQHLRAIRDIVQTDKYTHAEEIQKQFEVIMDEYLQSFEEDSMIEEILVRAYLRKLRNLYIVLMGIMKRDEKLLAL